MEIRKDEINILEEMEKEPIISQRQLSKRTGLSLGMVNILVKKCIKTGLVKVENLNSRTVKYILTPKGINEKTKKTLKYIKSSYKILMDISSKIDSLVKEDMKNGNDIFIYGKKDEIMEILVDVLYRNNKEYKMVEELCEIKNQKNKVVYIWDTELEIEMKNIKYTNILK